MYKITLIALFLILSLTTVYSQFPASYPFETYLDAEENLYVTGESGGDILIIKYGPNGNELFSQTFPNPGGLDKGMDIVATSDGVNIYTAGYIYNDTTDNYDIILIKYSVGVSGVGMNWHTEFDGADKDDKGFGLTMDASGNVYVCGFVTNSDNSTDYIVLGYNSSGSMIVGPYQYELEGNQVATDILTDNNYVYVIGSKDESGFVGIGAPTKDIMLLTYNIQQVTEPVETILNLSGTNEIPTSFMISEIALSTNPPIASKVAVAGYQDKFVSFTKEANYFIASFDRNPVGDGNQLEWSTDWGGSFDDYATGMTTDSSGNIVVTGYSRNTSEDDDFATLKFDKTDGAILWGPVVYNYRQINDRASSISRNGSTYAVSGYSVFTSVNSYLTKKYIDGIDNSESWTRSYEPNFSLSSNPVQYTDFGSDTYVLSDGSVITVMFGWNSTASAFAIVKYDEEGDESYALEPGYEDRPVINLSTADKQENRNFELKQNYPNPFNPSTMISYTIPAQSYVTLKVYDLLGREVAELVNGNENAGNYSKQFDASRLASGIYIYKLTAVSGITRFEKINKMTLIK